MCTRRSFSCLWRGSLDCDKLGQPFQGAQSHCGETTGELEAECGEGAVQTRTEGEEKRDPRCPRCSEHLGDNP